MLYSKEIISHKCKLHLHVASLIHKDRQFEFSPPLVTVTVTVTSPIADLVLMSCLILCQYCLNRFIRVVGGSFPLFVCFKRFLRWFLLFYLNYPGVGVQAAESGRHLVHKICSVTIAII